MSRLLEERFWEKVDRRGPDDCWLWTACTTDSGYGQISEGAGTRKLLRAHRVSYEIENGPITDGLQVLHECDNPPCCNPNHLFLGDHQANMADMVEKQRAQHQRREQHSRVKLTDAKVAEIRRDYVRGSSTHGQPALARKYNMSQTQICSIVRGEQWKPVY